MRKTVVLFLAVAALCLETGRGAAQPPTETPHPADVVRWEPWRPADTTSLSPAEAALRADLIRHVDVTEGHRPYPGNVFPLTGALIEGRTVWAAEVRPDGQWRWFRHRLRAPAQRRMARHGAPRAVLRLR